MSKTVSFRAEKWENKDTRHGNYVIDSSQLPSWISRIIDLKAKALENRSDWLKHNENQ